MAATAAVVTEKVTLAEPATTVTLAGTVAEMLLLASNTTEPPAGAGPLSVTVPVDPAPPTKLAGTNASDDTAGALMLSTAVCVAPP